MLRNRLLLCVCGLFAAGCGELGGDVSPPQSSAVEAGGDSDVKATFTDWAGLQEYISTQSGRVVVVDLWATNCLPCRREFPNLVALHRKHGEKIACVSFSTDYFGIRNKPPESYKEKVLEFLSAQNATFLNIISETESDELYDQIGLASIPAVCVYGPDGNLEKRFDNDDELYGDEGFNYTDHVIPLVEQLLGQDG